MYTHSVFLFIVLVALWSDSAFGCNRRRPPPPPPPPPGQPPAPPTPPPIVKVVRQREQKMTRNNCRKVEITTANSGQLDQGMTITGASAEEVQRAKQKLKNEGHTDQCLNAEQFKYVCEFSVFSEIALTTIYHPTGCGCAFTIQVIKPRIREPDVANLMSVNAAYSTKVTRFAIVVYDYEAEQVQAEIPEFSNMALSPETTAMIEAQVGADPNGDFSSITAGFAGVIKSFNQLPKELNKNDPANAHYVPAIQFTIEQVYTTGAMFKVPCSLKMHTAPNAYMSQCQPYRPEDAFSYSKRHSLTVEETQAASDKAWFREFYLFPKQESKCGNAASGYTPKSRYITSFYNDNLCTHEHGYMSFDREFESTFEASTAVVGGWKWKREFSETRVVFGVPHAFSKLNAVWCLGYSQINWASPSNFQATQVPVEKGVCSKLTVANPSKQENKYGEKHLSYPVTADTLQCDPIFSHSCNQDATLLGFQNKDPRDFEKRQLSTLLTGPRRLFCSSHDQEGNERVVFDTLTFRGVRPGEQLAKRNFDDALHPQPHHIHMVYSDEHDGLVHGRHAPELVARFNRHQRKRGEEEMVFDPVAAPPHRDNFALNNAAGSIDIKGSDSAPAGDHPMRVFPETYSAPLTLDPVQSESEDEPLTYDGELVNGVPPKFCEVGDIGCTCRDDSAAAACDHPYECKGGFCQRPACPEGQAGCKAHTDGKCEGELIVDSQGYCVYKPSCELGATGCSCDASNACADNKAQCLDNVCIVPVETDCAEGNPGCPCNADDGSCGQGASCDTFTGLCMFQACQAGLRGCSCNKVGNPCEDGFVCGSEGNCVQSECVPGDAGCRCLDSKGCNKKGFVCEELDRSGTNNICVGYDQCGQDQTQRCLDECGPGNILVCGKCDYSQPICREKNIQYCNPKSYLYKVAPCVDAGSSAASVFVSLAAAFIALLAAF